jgi:toxin HigB-1
MIRSFKTRLTKALYDGAKPKGVARDLVIMARRKLGVLDACVSFETLRSPSGNRLEKLKGDRQGQWSIRVNDQWRICFKWDERGPYDVEFCDYH